MSILIPDYLGQQVLSGIRSLKDYYHIDHAWNYKTLTNFLLSSRYIRANYKLSYLPNTPIEFSKEIINLHKDKNYSAILPFGLYSYFAFSHYFKHNKPNIPIMLPQYDSFLIANNKLKTLRFAENLGINIPKTFSDINRDDLRNIVKHTNFPLVLKCQTGTGVDQGVRYAYNLDELYKYWDELLESNSRTYKDQSNPIVQEFIPGYIHDACCLYIDGSKYGILTQIRELMNPIQGGIGAVNITTENPELCSIVDNLLTSLNWHGPAQIEFKFDSRDGKYKLIEINPKLWGTLDLSIKSGFNVTRVISDYLSGKPIQEFLNYKVGYRYFFSFPQAYEATIMYLNLFGIPNIRNIILSQREFNIGFSFSDPIPELTRMIVSLKKFKKLITKKHSYNFKNLEIPEFPYNKEK